MKKIIALVLALIMCLSLCACGGEKTINIGETATSDKGEITLTEVSFANEYNGITAENGYIFVVVNFTLKNVGKEDYGFFEISGGKSSKYSDIPYVDYNDGYTFAIDSLVAIGGKNYDSSCFGEPNDLYTKDLKPLSEPVSAVAAIYVPQEVELNSSAPLLIKMYLASTKGTEIVSYKIR